MASLNNTMETVFSRIEVTGFCWNWTGNTASGGYGRVWMGNQVYSAHRLMYEYLVGPIPAGLQIDHLCRNVICVNPDHLEPVTAKVNLSRNFSPPAMNAQKHYCSNGHEFTESNVYHRPDGTGKHCRQCALAAGARYRAKKRTELLNRSNNMNTTGMTLKISLDKEQA